MTVASLFSPTEHTVMALLADGLQVKDIARRLAVEPSTVSTHIRRASIKLNAETPRKAVIAFVKSQYTGWGGELEYLSWGKP